jgi:hypothetical protein
MSKIECADVLRQLSNYIEGEVPPALMNELEKHVQNCENCRIVLDTTRKTISLYHIHAADQQAPDKVVEHLYRTLNIEEWLPGKKENG